MKESEIGEVSGSLFCSQDAAVGPGWNLLQTPECRFTDFTYFTGGRANIGGGEP
jgi:hypothetical protein